MGLKNTVAVTGANGFIGRAFCQRAESQRRIIRRFVRADITGESVALDLARANATELARMLAGVTTIVHLAGRAHVTHETIRDAESAYLDANERATHIVAEAALAAGVRRFILTSTVKVNGEATLRGHRLKPDAATSPQDAYARSKLAAEAALARIASGTPMQATVLRLPLVYGAGARGNFRRLVDAVRQGRWLPFGAVDNARSVIGIENLLDALEAAIDAQDAVGGTHFVADADSVSTPGLVRAIGEALGVAPRLLPIPVPLLRLAGAVSGHRHAVARVTSSLEVDPSSFAAATGWQPRRFSIDAATVVG